MISLPARVEPRQSKFPLVRLGAQPAGVWAPVVTGLALTLAGQPILWLSPSSQGLHSADVVGGALVATAALPFAAVRRAPVAALCVSAVGLFAYGSLGYPASPADLATLFLLGWVVVVSRPIVAIFACASLVAASGIVAIVRPGPHPAAYIVGGLLAPAVAAVVGVAGRGFRQRAEMARLELVNQVKLQYLLAEKAANVERLRIAREMHDAVGHGVTIAMLSVEAARKLIKIEPGRAEDLLNIAYKTGQQTMGELQQLLRVLRTGDDHMSSEARSLNAVVQRFAGPGLEITLTIDDDCRVLPPDIERVAVAIVAEGLANVVRHANARRALVSASTREGSTVFAVIDDGRGPGAAAFGHGLTGAAERANSLGGQLLLVASPQGGSRLEVTLPRQIDREQ